MRIVRPGYRGGFDLLTGRVSQMLLQMSLKSEIVAVESPALLLLSRGLCRMRLSDRLEVELSRGEVFVDNGKRCTRE